jgi:long-chain acyl-CoA synthetase
LRFLKFLLFCLDTSFDEFRSFEKIGITVIPCNPVAEHGKILRLMYGIKNFKKLKNKFRAKHNDKYFLKHLPTKATEDNIFSDAVYLHSGGTTGEPKIVALSSFALNSLANIYPWFLDTENIKDCHMLAALPMFHGYGLCMGIHILLSNGGVSTLMPKFSVKETIKYIKKNQMHFIIGVPALYESLLRNDKFKGPHLKNLTTAWVGGDFVSKSLLTRFNQVMIENDSKCRLFEGYGLTETVTVATVNTHRYNKENSVGKILPNVKAKTIDLKTGKNLGFNKDGEICLSGETLMNGYRFSDDAGFVVEKDGTKWIKTGDFGSIDKDNFIFYKQRLKRIVVVSGVNVFPRDIENIVSSFPEVYECAAVGVDDLKRDHMIKLFIVLNENYEGDTIDDRINKIIKEELGVYALPKEIVYLEKMPKTMIGKIDVTKLK